jgi:hypothetical protein
MSPLPTEAPARPNTTSTKLAMASAIMILIVLGVAAYQFALKLPLFWDDIFQFAWLDQASFAQVLSSPVSGLNYFRPLAFLVWKALRVSEGRFDPFSLHLVNLILHVLNACLLAGIVRRMVPLRRTLTGLGAGALFLLFPFSFQSVAPVNSLMHPLHAAFILAGVWTYLLSKATRRSALRALSALLAGASILAHENGALAPLLVTLTALCSLPRQSLKQFVLDVAPYWVAALVFFILWRSAPRSGDPLALNGLFSLTESRLQNAAYFLQAFAFPVSWLAGPLKQTLHLQNDSLAIAITCLPVVSLWLGLALATRRGAIAAWSMGWFALAAAPAILMLPFTYTLESPRLVYLASVGSAVFWALPLCNAWRSHAKTIVNVALAGLIVIASGAWGFSYIQRRAALYAQLGGAITQVHQALETSRPCAQTMHDSALLVNYPDWFFVAQPEYLVGHDGLTTLSTGDTLSDLYRVNFGQSRPFTTATLPDIQPAGAVYKSMGEVHTLDSLQALLRQSGPVIVNAAQQGGVNMRLAGCLLAENQVAPTTYRAKLGDALMLRAFELHTAQDELSLTLDWQALATPAQDTTIFVQVLDAGGALVAQADGYPLLRTSPPRLWQAGDIWRDVRTLQLPTATKAGGYRILVGAYLTDGGQRLAATDAQGQRLPDDAYVITP